MEKSAMNADIKTVKLKNYMKKHPSRTALAFYCLGRLNIAQKKYKEAEECFNQALSHKRDFMSAKIGIMETYLCRKKFIKSVNFYNNECKKLHDLKSFRHKTVKAVSLNFDEISNLIKGSKIFAKIILKYTMQYIHKLLDKDPDNPLINLLLAIYYLSENQDSRTARTVYGKCVNYDGLNDNLRWALVKAISFTKPSIYENADIAGKFTAIPDDGCPTEYINCIFVAALTNGSKASIKKVFRSVKDCRVLTCPNLWKFVYWCTENNIYDHNVWCCCQLLIDSGWIDPLVRETVNRLKELGIAARTDENAGILDLYWH